MVLKAEKYIPSEKEVEKEIITALRLRGIYCWKNQSVGVFDPRRKVYLRPSVNHINGVSDILGILPDGRFLAIEVKKPVKNPRSEESLRKLATEDQLRFIDEINKKGGLAFVADRLDVVLEKIFSPDK